MAVSDSEERRLEARRDFPKKAGKFAPYTLPVLRLFIYPSMQIIAQSGSEEKAAKRLRENNGKGWGVGKVPPGARFTPPGHQK